MSLELLNRIMRNYILSKKNSVIENVIEERIKKIEDDIILVANVLTNIMLVGREKRKRCLFFNAEEGICGYWRLEVEIPTLTLFKKPDGYYVNILQHPELCAVCSYWREGVYK